MQELDIKEILKYLPHRYPFLLIDRVLDYKKGDYLKAIKNVSINEPFFQGHFPVKPLFPGVLMIEAMAQATAILAFCSLGGYPDDDDLYFLAGVDKVRFRRPVEPGDQLDINAKIVSNKRSIWHYEAQMHVGTHLICAANLTSAMKKVKI